MSAYQRYNLDFVKKKTVEGYLTSRAGAERSMLAVFLLCQNQLQVQTLPNLVFH